MTERRRTKPISAPNPSAGPIIFPMTPIWVTKILDNYSKALRSRKKKEENEDEDVPVYQTELIPSTAPRIPKAVAPRAAYPTGNNSELL